MDDENLTRNEEEIVENDDVTGEEAHRIEEFRDLRNLIEEVLGEIRSMRDDFAGIREDFTNGREALENARAEFVANGGVITDIDDDGDADIVISGMDALEDEYNDYIPEKLDLDMD